MATQAELRSRAVQGVRKLRQLYRKAQTAGNRAEQELDRLATRKTLISMDSLKKVSERLVEYHAAVDQAAAGLRDLYIIIQGTVQV